MAGKFMVAANAIISRDDGKILIVKRKPDYDQSPDKWDTVSGRLEQHLSSVSEELLREIQEELGLNFKVRIVAPFSTYHFYRGGNKDQELVGIDYIVKYISGDVVLSDEHTDYKWIDPMLFSNLNAPDSLKKTVSRYMKVRDLYLENESLFEI